MKKKLIPYIFWGISLLILSCSDDDGRLPHRDDFEPCRFDFPQGTSVADKEIQRIHEETGAYIIYKNITSKDLNRNWIDPGSTSFVGTPIEEKDLSFYLDFLNRNLLKYVEGKYLKNSLPVYFYLLQRLESVKGNRPTVVDLKTNGLDFWAFGMSVEEIKVLSSAERANLRNRMVYPVLRALVEKGIITAPDEFSAGINYETAITKTPTTSTGGKDKNYYRYRGFVDFVDDVSFDGTEVPMISMVKKNNADLLSYIRIALYYSEQEFLEEYPQATFSLIYDRYQIITSYLKKTYDVDLKHISSAE